MLFGKLNLQEIGMKGKIYGYFFAIPMLALLFAVSAQDSAMETAKVEKGIALVGDVKIPVYKGVEEVTVNKSPDGSLYITYMMIVPGGRNAKNGDKIEAKDRAALIKFYTGKSVFGVKIGKVKKNDEHGGAFEFQSCAKDATKPSLVFSISSIGEAPGNSVSFGNKCQ
jgi:hypothetical protein